MLKKHKEGAIAIVVSEPMASLVRSHLSGIEIGDFWKNGGFCGKWEVISPEPLPVAPRES
jgi:probable phosphoglycerate mutase